MRKNGNEIFPIQFNSEYKVVQANELIRAKQDEMSVIELKLIRLAITQILKGDNEFYTYSCKLTDLTKYLGISSGYIYEEIDKITTALMSKVIRIKGDKDRHGRFKWIKFHWVDTARYEDGVLTMKLSDELKPFLLDLYDMFCSYEYGFVAELNSAYSIRLWELLYSFYGVMKSNKTVTYNGIELQKNSIAFTVEYMREFFNCENKYLIMNDFIRKVIDRSVQELNKKIFVNHPVTYRTIKSGRNITHIVFRIKFDKSCAHSRSQARKKNLQNSNRQKQRAAIDNFAGL